MEAFASSCVETNYLVNVRDILMNFVWWHQPLAASVVTLVCLIFFRCSIWFNLHDRWKINIDSASSKTTSTHLKTRKIYGLSCDSLKWAARLLYTVSVLRWEHLCFAPGCLTALWVHRKQVRRKVPCHCCMLRNRTIITGGSDGPLLLWIWDQKGIRDILPLTSKIIPITNATQSASSQAPSCSTRH